MNSLTNSSYIPILLISCFLLGSVRSLLEERSAVATEIEETPKESIEAAPKMAVPDLTQLKSHPEVLECVKECIEGKSVYLGLSYLDLTKIPSGIPELAHVEFVDLDQNLLSRLSPEITKMSQLKALRVDSNELETIETISDLPALNVLYLKNNRLTTLPDDFGDLSSLRFLNLRSNRLSSLPESFAKCTELEYLILGGNELTQLPSNLGDLTKLKVLVLSKNKLEGFSQNFRKLSSLQYLYLNQNKLRSLPEGIELLTELLDLSFFGNPIGDDQLLKLKTMTKLQYMDIRHTNVTKAGVAGLQQALPDCFIRDSVTPPLHPQMDIVLSRIREADETDEIELNLKRLGLTDLPIEIREASKIDWLWLGQNKLKTVPPEIKYLKSLTLLSLRDNQIESLPDEIVELEELSIVNLHDNQLTKIPPQIYKLKEAFSLTFSFNSISDLSDDCVAWSKIDKIGFSFNEFKTFPLSVTKLPSLRSLSFDENQIENIPSEISNLKQLEYLELSNNKISSLPKSFGSLKKLYSLSLDENPITDADLEYIKPLKNLEDLDIRKTHITYEGFLSLKKALPNCEISASYKEFEE